MKVLVADSFSLRHLEQLRELGLEVEYQPQLGADDLAAALAGVHVLIVRSTRVGREAIFGATALGLIVRAGAGVNTIDRQAASERGVFVANCPGQNAVAVAELTLGLLLALDRRIPDQVADLRRGIWNKSEYSKAQGLLGRTLGVVGTGAIGQAVIARARAFGMRVVAMSRSLTPERAAALGVGHATTVAELCGAADAVTLHVPLTPETRGLLGEAAIARLRPGAIVINTSRAEVVDGAALRRAIVDKGLRVALDVFEHEPEGGSGTFVDDIVGLPGVYGTHHVGASTEQAQNAIADETVRIVRAFVQGGEVPNCVNVLPPQKTLVRAELVVRHKDRIGVLAEVLAAIRRHQINVEQMQNQIFEGAQAACARIRLSARPSAELLAEIRSRTDEIIHVDVLEVGGP
ncbi:MAG: NAD(P)-dependent oxidoreductase [Myxococcales bacterium]|nr:NAD(P)-binding domain-containing protein [Myxococcota bacterium]MDW8280713.1 NAD(P)-dependent oxidoreductase [Myxococcales bacterium]